MLTGGAMHLVSRWTEFQHFAGDHHAPSCFHRSQGIDHGMQRLRIRIVAIVDDRDVTQLENLPTLVGRHQTGQRLDGFRKLQPANYANANRSQGIQDVVFSDQGQMRVYAAPGCDHVKFRALRAAGLYVLGS